MPKIQRIRTRTDEFLGIFGNAATALSFGFVKSRDGTWQVMPNCHR